MKSTIWCRVVSVFLLLAGSLTLVSTAEADHPIPCPEGSRIIGVSEPYDGSADEWRAMIAQAAFELGVTLDLNLMVAVIHYESLGDPRVCGPQNQDGSRDLGLIQYNSSWRWGSPGCQFQLKLEGKDFHKRTNPLDCAIAEGPPESCVHEDWGCHDQFDPWVNIRVGVWLMTCDQLLTGKADAEEQHCGLHNWATAGKALRAIDGMEPAVYSGQEIRSIERWLKFWWDHYSGGWPSAALVF